MVNNILCSTAVKYGVVSHRQSSAGEGAGGEVPAVVYSRGTAILGDPTKNEQLHKRKDDEHTPPALE